VREIGTEHFDGDLPVMLQVFGSINGRHSPGT
jgi:hypothetical protein